jgi:hypothetical protein
MRNHQCRCTTFSTRMMQTICHVAALCLLVACGSGSTTSAGAPINIPAPFAAPATAAPTSRSDGLSDDGVRTLTSLAKVDDYPLYTMHYYGAYSQRSSSIERNTDSAWACSLFAALGDTSNLLYGRNFDWDYSPALLVFTAPPDGYATVSMVDIAYLGFAGDSATRLLDLPLAERRALLDAPSIPFDGMNERGLVIGMAAVPPGQMRPSPDKPTLGSLGVIRRMLDRASTVDEAVTIMQSYNIDLTGGPPIHYLIADRSGRAALVEFYQGKLVIIPNESPWHLATNFLRAAVESAEGQCWRYDAISQRLAETQGRLTTQEAVALLERVSQSNTSGQSSMASAQAM